MNLNSTLWSGTIFALHSYIEVWGCEEKSGYIFNQALVDKGYMDIGQIMEENPIWKWVVKSKYG